MSRIPPETRKVDRVSERSLVVNGIKLANHLYRQMRRGLCFPRRRWRTCSVSRPAFGKTYVISAAALLLLVCSAAHADWKLISTQIEPSFARGLEHRYLVLEDSTSGDRVSLELALFSPKSLKLRVIDQPVEPRVDLNEAMRREKCLAGVNGGYFDPDYKPIGLLVVDGKTVAPLQRARLLTGVLAGLANKVQISRISELSQKQKFEAAVECGPMIVDLGKPVAGLEATRGARRTFAALVNGDRAGLGFCSDVTLSDLAKILTEPLSPDLRIRRALNLDGGSSSGFWFARKNGTAFSIPEEKTVRNFVAIVPK
jgi:Phosphodiester glycosidase